ncbi:MAG: hypothetical protein Q8R92_13715 [Deltaproteobacteria bacterium]|nr:hypothetical protein [Deltaproteobacteria bacterium]
MPIDARIPLQTTTIDTAPGLNALAGAFRYREQQKERKEERQQDLELRRQELGMRQQEMGQRKEVLDMQIASAKYTQLDDREKRRMRSTVLGAAQLNGYLEAGDTEGAASFLRTRKGQIEQAKAIDPTMDSNETDQALQMLQSGNIDQLKKTTQSAIKLGQDLKILDKPEKIDSFAPVYGPKGEVVAQRNVKTGEVKASPLAPEKSKLMSPEELQQKMSIAAAGKPSVTVKVDAKMGESFAKEIGPMMTESRSAAQGALQAIDTVKRIRGAIEGGNVSLGPTATLRQNLNQFGQVLGVTGETTEEKLVNTRNVIRGLAQLAISARKQLKGQGQVSDYEGKLIQRGEAGEVGDFTMPELKDFIGVTEQMAGKVVKEHKRTLDVMRSDPSLERFVPFYGVGEDAEELTVGRFKVKVK